MKSLIYQNREITTKANNLEELLVELDLNGRKLVIELNDDILDNGIERSTVLLNDGDRINIFSIVAGG